MKDSINLSTAGQFVCVDQCGAGTFNGSLEVWLQLLDHSTKEKKIIPLIINNSRGLDKMHRPTTAQPIHLL